MSSHSFSACCTQKPADEIVNSLRRGSPLAMGDGKERDTVEVDLFQARLLAEGQNGDHVPGFVRAKAYGGPRRKDATRFPVEYDSAAAEFGSTSCACRRTPRKQHKKTQE